MKQNSIYSGDLILVNASHEFRTEDKSILVPVDDQFSNILVNKKISRCVSKYHDGDSRTK